MKTAGVDGASETKTQPQGPPANRAPDLAAPPSAENGRHRLRILLGLGVLVLLAAVAGGYWYFFMRGIVFTDDARLAGHLVDLAPEINGRLVEVLVREGQPVHKGQDVFRLDPETQRAALSQAEASLASAKANLAVSQAGYEKAANGNRPEEIKAAGATVKRLQNEEKLALLELQRTEALKQTGIAAQDELDRAQSTHEGARQNLENAAQNLALLQQGSRKEDLDAAKADVNLARSRVNEAGAALERAKRDLERCCVKAPFDGWVVRRWLDPGAMPLAGQPVASVFDPSTLRVDANIEEKYLDRIAIHDEADIELDAYPGLHLKGQVVEILRATNSQFSLIPAEGVAGTFIKVSQRVPLRISVTVPADLPLGPGLSAEVRIRSNSAQSHAAAPAQGPARD